MNLAQRLYRSVRRPLDVRKAIQVKVPLEGNVFIGGGDFVAVGDGFFQIFRDHCDLSPDDKILEVGSGQGRMARPLVDFLSSENGEYHGIEIVKKGVRFCQRAYAKNDNFHFHHIPVYNRHYNRHGTVRAADFQFPFKDGKFTFVFLTSVFTHMLPTDVERYLREIQRVLNPGGRLLLTCFLLEPQSLSAIESGISGIPLNHPVSEFCRTKNPHDPEAAIGYQLDFMLDLLKKLNFISPKVHLGSWARPGDRLTFQDVIVINKPDQ